MASQKVDECIQCVLNTSDLTVQTCPEFPYGRKLIDSFGDFIIFSYDIGRDQVMYCFKNAEKYWFTCSTEHGMLHE